MSDVKWREKRQGENRVLWREGKTWEGEDWMLNCLLKDRDTLKAEKRESEREPQGGRSTWFKSRV